MAMANTGKAKLKILYLLKILQEETDAEHGLSMAQIIERLSEYGIGAERKSIYDDIKVLREFDVDVRTYQRNPVEYAIERRDFKFDELVLMVDAIQSSRAITDRQAQQLIRNVKTFASNGEQEKLDRSVHVVGRIKTENESVLSVVDAIHDAMRRQCKVAFPYSKLGTDGKRYLTHHGEEHVVTPMGVTYDDGFYYLTAWSDEHEGPAEFRLDRMDGIRVLEDVPGTKVRQGADHRVEEEDAAVFGRFKGQRMTAVLLAKPDKLEIVTDRFGDAVESIAESEDGARVRVRLFKSKQFFGWVAGMNKAVRIIGPKSLVAEYNAYLLYLLKDYLPSLEAVAEPVWTAFEDEPTVFEIEDEKLIGCCSDLERLGSDAG